MTPKHTSLTPAHLPKAWDGQDGERPLLIRNTWAAARTDIPGHRYAYSNYAGLGRGPDVCR